VVFNSARSEGLQLQYFTARFKNLTVSNGSISVIGGISFIKKTEAGTVQRGLEHISPF
jgi:hypothetical protein